MTVWAYHSVVKQAHQQHGLVKLGSMFVCVNWLLCVCVCMCVCVRVCVFVCV